MPAFFFLRKSSLFFLLLPLIFFLIFIPHGHDVLVSYLCKSYAQRQQEFLAWPIVTFSVHSIYLGRFIAHICFLLASLRFIKVYFPTSNFSLCAFGLFLVSYPLLLITSNILNQGLAISFFLLCLTLFPFGSSLLIRLLFFVFSSILGSLLHFSFLLPSSILLLSSLSFSSFPNFSFYIRLSGFAKKFIFYDYYLYIVLFSFCIYRFISSYFAVSPNLPLTLLSFLSISFVLFLLPFNNNDSLSPLFLVCHAFTIFVLISLCLNLNIVFIERILLYIYLPLLLLACYSLRVLHLPFIRILSLLLFCLSLLPRMPRVLFSYLSNF